MSQMRENLKTGVDSEEAHVLSPAHSQQQHQHRNLQPRNHRIGLDLPEPEIPRGEPVIPQEDHEINSGEGEGDGSNEDDIDNEVYNENDNPQEKHLGVNNKSVDGHRQRGQANHRKRKNSVKGGGDGNYIPPYKKNRFRRQTSVLPSKFLLGGNIHDPLNLASLADEKVNAQLNRATPVSSPLAVPNEPRRKNSVSAALNDANERKDSSDVGTWNCPKKHKNRKHRPRKRHGRKRTDSECSIASSGTGDNEDNGDTDEETENHVKTSIEHKKDRHDSVGETLAVCLAVVSRARKTSEKSAENHNNNIVNVTTTNNTSNVKDSIETKDKDEDVKSSNEKETACVSQNVAAVDKITSAEVEVKSEIATLKEDVTKKVEECDNYHENSNDVEDKEKISEIQEKALVTEASRLRDECKSRPSSDYVPLSSYYAPSPFILDVLEPGDSFEVQPFESPSLTNYCCNDDANFMEPFSPPPSPEVPPFIKRMQLYASAHHLSPQHMMSPRSQPNLLHRHFCRKRYRNHKSHKLDPIVSPVIPQHGNRRKHHHPKKNGPGFAGPSCSQMPVAGPSHSSVEPGSSSATNQKDKNKRFRKKDQIFQFGNYQRYYGYRTSTDGEDPRLRVFKREWFVGKDVLDVGCNIGHITLSIARDFGSKRVHGIDIDNYLIQVARKNIKHYMIRDPKDKDIIFPNSLPLMFGAIQPPPRNNEKISNVFPYNVSFSHENYVLENDEMLSAVTPEYDVILLLSIAKWIHLNHGDDGLKRLFRRCYLHLRPGGKLILEPQPWSSYKRKKKLTEHIFKTYQAIRFYPDFFQEYLIKTVGFVAVDTIGPPTHHPKGFQRPLLVFTKPMGSPTSSLMITAPAEVSCTATSCSANEPSNDSGCS